MTDLTMLGAMPEDEETLAFLRMVLPEEGHGHYVAAVKASKGMQHVFLTTINDLCRTLFEVDRSGHDCYFALATFRENTGRTAANATALKALRLDIDVGKGEGSYSSTQDAALAVAKFAHDTGLGRPLIVESGSGGLHVYWPFECSVPPDEWRPYAEGLKHLCVQHRLLADAVCTADVARILRAPGTHNRKRPKQPKKVVVNFLHQVQPYPLERFAPLLTVAPAQRQNNVVSLKLASLGAAPSFLQEATRPVLAPAIETAYNPAYGLLVAGKCAQLAHMRDTRGVMPEPEWKACIGVLAFCLDGEKLAHEWSKNDERYSEAETQKKFDDSRAVGAPITCAHFRGLNRRCDNCPQNVTTPKTLGESLFDPYEPTSAPAIKTGIVSWEKNATNTALKPKSLANAIMSLNELGVVCRYDVFHNRATVEHPSLEVFGSKFSDAHARALRAIMISQHHHDPGFDTVWQAIKTQCEANQYDPITDYLDGLSWDGVPRLDAWLVTYLGADSNSLNCAFGRKTLLAAVRRARQPGAKFDHMLVLEGLQGTGKTSAVQILAGEGNFSEQKILHLDTKAQSEQIAGKWLYEISELAGLHGRAVEDVKQFISRLSDEARPAFGREPVERLRRCVFIGTTNNTRYLSDDTGNRRFWPVKTGRVDLEALKRDRDQIWAEAAHYDKKGESLFLPKSLWAAATAAQKERLNEDLWTDYLAPVQGRPAETQEGVEYRVSTSEVISAHLKIPTERINPAVGRRINAIMRDLGWELKTYRDEEGRCVRGYTRLEVRK